MEGDREPPAPSPAPATMGEEKVTPVSSAAPTTDTDLGPGRGANSIDQAGLGVRGK